MCIYVCVRVWYFSHFEIAASIPLGTIIALYFTAAAKTTRGIAAKDVNKIQCSFPLAHDHVTIIRRFNYVIPITIGEINHCVYKYNNEMRFFAKASYSTGARATESRARRVRRFFTSFLHREKGKRVHVQTHRTLYTPVADKVVSGHGRCCVSHVRIDHVAIRCTGRETVVVVVYILLSFTD